MTGRLQETVDNYLLYHRIEGSTEATIKFYRKELRLFLQDLDPNCQTVGDLHAFHLLEHLAAMKDRGCAPRTVRTRWQAVTTWLNWCVEWELIGSSPAAHVRAPKVPKVRKPFLNEHQFQALIDLCPLNTLTGARRQSMLWLMATTGVRRREMWMMTQDDLDWDASTVRVIYRKGQTERRVPFDRRCQRAMLRYLHQRTDTLDWLRVTEEGRRLAFDSIWQDLKRLADRADVQLQDTCHIFRRTFAANAVRQHIPRPHVQAVAGWSTPQMLDQYVAAMEAEQGAIDAFREFNPFGDR